MSKRITIQLVGVLSDKEDVRLNDFIEQLKTIKRALREAELGLSGQQEATLDYKIVDLRHNSPATVVLEAIEVRPPFMPRLRERVVSDFTNELRLIKNKKTLLYAPDMQRLSAYQDIGAQPNSNITKVRIGSARTLVTIDDRFQRNLNEIVGPDEFAAGSISGMLEAINLHNTNKFTIYPTIGPRKLSGTFDPNLRNKIKEGIGAYVTVRGTLRYKAWSPFPHGVRAEDIDVHEPESELPKLADLRGAFAGVTGDLNSAEFIDQLRNEAV